MLRDSREVKRRIIQFASEQVTPQIKEAEIRDLPIETRGCLYPDEIDHFDQFSDCPLKSNQKASSEAQLYQI